MSPRRSSRPRRSVRTVANVDTDLEQTYGLPALSCTFVCAGFNHFLTSFTPRISHIPSRNRSGWLNLVIHHLTGIPWEIRLWSSLITCSLWMRPNACRHRSAFLTHGCANSPERRSIATYRNSSLAIHETCKNKEGSVVRDSRKSLGKESREGTHPGNPRSRVLCGLSSRKHNELSYPIVYKAL